MARYIFHRFVMSRSPCPVSQLILEADVLRRKIQRSWAVVPRELLRDLPVARCRVRIWPGGFSRLPPVVQSRLPLQTPALREGRRLAVVPQPLRELLIVAVAAVARSPLEVCLIGLRARRDPLDSVDPAQVRTGLRCSFRTARLGLRRHPADTRVAAALPEARVAHHLPCPRRLARGLRAGRRRGLHRVAAAVRQYHRGCRLGLLRTQPRCPHPALPHRRTVPHRAPICRPGELRGDHLHVGGV